MSQGLTCYDADAVAGQTITINFSYKYNYTITDAASPFHSYVSTYQQQVEFSGTVVAHRKTDVTGTVADDGFRIVTGETLLSGTSIPAVLDLLAALTGGDPLGVADTGMEWASQPYTEIYTGTYTGPGKPADYVDDFSADATLTVGFGVASTDQMSWGISGYAPWPSIAAFTVDPFTLKKSGSNNFGFTYNNTVPNPGTWVVFGEGSYDVTAWDVETSIDVTVS